MRAYQFPQTEVERATVVSRFGGVDFRTHPTKVSLSRSPDMQNLICDQNDFLVKRTGWKTQQAYTAPIYGLFPLPDGEHDVEHIHPIVVLYERAPLLHPDAPSYSLGCKVDVPDDGEYLLKFQG